MYPCYAQNELVKYNQCKQCSAVYAVYVAVLPPPSLMVFFILINILSYTASNYQLRNPLRGLHSAHHSQWIRMHLFSNIYWKMLKDIYYTDNDIKISTVLYLYTSYIYVYYISAQTKYNTHENIDRSISL